MVCTLCLYGPLVQYLRFCRHESSTQLWLISQETFACKTTNISQTMPRVHCQIKLRTRGFYWTSNAVVEEPSRPFSRIRWISSSTKMPDTLPKAEEQGRNKDVGQERVSQDQENCTSASRPTYGIQCQSSRQHRQQYRYRGRHSSGSALLTLRSLGNRSAGDDRVSW